jgi:hypothetical protein
MGSAEMIAKLAALRSSALVFLVCAGSVSFATDASARDWEIKLDERAWACSASYSRFPLNVLNGKDREAAICVGEGRRKPMSRAEAYNRCRAQFGATSLLINWTSKGWLCRYYGR